MRPLMLADGTICSHQKRNTGAHTTHIHASNLEERKKEHTQKLDIHTKEKTH